MKWDRSQEIHFIRNKFHLIYDIIMEGRASLRLRSQCNKWHRNWHSVTSYHYLAFATWSSYWKHFCWKAKGTVLSCRLIFIRLDCKPAGWYSLIYIWRTVPKWISILGQDQGHMVNMRYMIPISTLIFDGFEWGHRYYDKTQSPQQLLWARLSDFRPRLTWNVTCINACFMS